jgi:hypothetical protein
MQGEIFMNSKNLSGLLNVVSKKLGISPAQLQQELETGKFDRALQNLSPAEQAMFQNAINNPGMVNMLMSQPQAQALYKKLSGENQ